MQVVGAIIENSKGEFLLQQRDNKAPSFQLYWSLFGGKVEENEPPEQAIRRELGEEIGLDTSKVEEVTQVQENLQENGTKQFIFLIKTDVSIQELILAEGAKMEFVPRNDLFNRNFAFNIKEILENYLHKIKTSLI